MDTTQKANLLKAKKYKAEKELLERQEENDRRFSVLEKAISEFSDVLSRGINIEGIDNLDVASERIELFGITVKELLQGIAVQLVDLKQLDIPKSISLDVKTVLDDSLLDALQKVGDDGELVSKLQKLDQAIVLLASTVEETQKQGKRPEDYLPVRLVDGPDSNLNFVTNLPFGGGGFSSTGLTDAQLRASPVPVSASIDTTGLATSTKQDTLIGHVDGIETLITSTNTKLDTLNTTAATPAKATDAYSIAAISDDGTYKYFWFEDASLNYYIMRKTIATSVFQYTKGTGGYASVYQSSILGPSGSPSWASYGNTF